MEYVVILVIFLASLTFNYLNGLRLDKAEKESFREFVLASKAKNIDEYSQAIPLGDDYVEPALEDELVDLDQLSPEELLQIKQKEYADK